jgi:hypothetical protein
VQIDDTCFERYFQRVDIRCPSCTTALDWWQTARTEVSENFMQNQAFAIVSARSTIFRLVLQPNERASYRLTDFGIPADAKILYVNYTPSGTLFPVELQGNVATAKTSRQTVTLWPVPLREPPGPTDVNVFVTWIAHSQLDESWKSIISAFEAYVGEDYTSCVVPANVAVESALSITLNSYLPQYVGKERTASFLKDAATYSYQLNVVLPMLVGLLGLPALPEHIRGSLNGLRGIRNDLAHLGTTDSTLDRERCADLLCAALFGFHYVLLIRKKLSSET